MMVIQDSFYTGKISLAIENIIKFLNTQRDLEISNANDEYEKENIRWTYDVKPKDIWVESAKNPKLFEGGFLTCFVVHTKGFGFVDKLFPKVNYEHFLKYIELEIPKLNTDEEIKSFIKSNPNKTTLFYKGDILSIIIDRSTYSQEVIVKALGDCQLDSININYNRNTTKDNLISGQCIISHYFIDTVSLNIYDSEEIKIL